MEIIHKSQIVRLKMRRLHSTVVYPHLWRVIVICSAPSVAARPSSIENGLVEDDSKHIAREWNREIEAEMRRLATKQDDGPWKIIVWVLLEAVWLAALVVVLGVFTRLH